MTIRRGESWGAPGGLADGAPVFDSDRAAARAIQRSIERGEPLDELGLTGGDLHRTLGAPRRVAEDLARGAGMRFPLDVGVAELDGGEPLVFLAHLIAVEGPRLTLWRSRTVVVMNAAFVGDANLGPRAHPNDGLLDLTDGTLPRRDRRAARRRSSTGTHVPHPALTQRRGRELEIDAGGLHVWLDGEPVGPATQIRCSCRPDAVTVVV